MAPRSTKPNSPHIFTSTSKYMAPIQSKVKQYLEGELDFEMISEKSYQTLGIHPDSNVHLGGNSKLQPPYYAVEMWF